MFLKKTWALILTFAAIVVMPVYVHAAKDVGHFGLDDLLGDSVVISILALFASFGGFLAMFVRTEADEFVTFPKVFKVLAGFALGVTVGMALYNDYGLSIYLILPVVIVTGTLGAPIVVYYVRWFCNPKTQKMFEEKLDDLARRGRK